MVLHKLERRDYGGKWPGSIQNLHSFKEGLILLCQSILILKMRRITHLHDSAHFTIPLSILSILKSNSILKSAILSVAKNKLKQKFF